MVRQVIGEEERRECERLAAQLEEIENVLLHTEERAQQAEERVQRVEERVQLERERVQRAEERVQQEKKRVQRAEEMIQQAGKRVQRTEKRAQQAEEREQQDREALGQKVRQAEARAAELQRRLDEVEGREREKVAVQQQAIAAEQRGPSWEVRKEDLPLTGEVIGTGGWAEVRVAHLKVAAKNLNSDSLREKWQSLLESATPTCSAFMEPSWRDG